MTWPSTLVFIRHGESQGNIMTLDERALHSMSSHAYPLTERGRGQANHTGRYLRDRFGNFDVRYVSYYRRSRETMELMFPGFELFEDPRLAEAQRGIWHTMTENQILMRYPEEIERKEREGLYHYRAPGGENQPDVELRIHSFLGTLARDYDGQKVVICGHGHWFILFQRLMHRFPIEEALRRYREAPFENASVTIYEKTRINDKDRLVLTEENIIPWKGQIE